MIGSSLAAMAAWSSPSVAQWLSQARSRPPWIHRVDGSRIDDRIATSIGRSNKAGVKHVASDDVLDTESERSQRRVDPCRSTNEQSHVVAGSEHAAAVGANGAVLL